MDIMDIDVSCSPSATAE